MNKRIAFKNMDHSSVLEDFANKHLEKIEKLIETERSPISIDLVIEGHPNHAHNKIELIVKTPDYKLVAHHEGDDMFEQINIVMDKMVQEIRRAKEKKHDLEKKKDRYKGA